MKNPIIGLIIVAILFGAGGFFGGMQYQKGQRITFGNGQYTMTGGQGGVRFNRGGQNGNQNAIAVRGQILSSDANSITVKLANGGSRIVMLGSNPSITEATAASKESLKTGENVAVFGTNNSDGSVTAQTIQLNPQQGGRTFFNGNGG